MTNSVNNPAKPIMPAISFLHLAPPTFLSAEQIAEHDAAAAAKADTERRRAMIARHIPAKDITRLLGGDLVETAALARVKAWLEDPDARRLLVLSGDKDAGKTTAAAYAVSVDPSAADRQWLARGASFGRYIEAELLLNAWWCVGPKPDASGVLHDADLVTGMNKAELLTCSLLVIDDMGQEPGRFAGEVGEAIDVIVRARCDRMLRTVLTTNIITNDKVTGAAMMAARYGERGARLLERLTEHGIWATCPVEGFRGEKRRERVLEERWR